MNDRRRDGFETDISRPSSKNGRGSFHDVQEVDRYYYIYVKVGSLLTTKSLKPLPHRITALQHFTTRYNTLQHFTTLYNTLYNTLQHFTTLYNTGKRPALDRCRGDSKHQVLREIRIRQSLQDVFPDGC